MANRAEQLFDVAATSPKQIASCKADWGVSMTANEFTYYEDQKGDWKMECDKAVDPVFYWATMRRESLRARQEEYRKERREQFSGKDLREIDQILLEECGKLSSPETSPETSPVEMATMSSSTATPSIESNRAKKRKLYMETEVEEETSNFPPHLAHIRTSERKVRDEVYTTLASLTGHGLSVRESCLAVVEVGNGMIGRQWKMPDRRNIRRWS